MFLSLHTDTVFEQREQVDFKTLEWGLSCIELKHMSVVEEEVVNHSESVIYPSFNFNIFLIFHLCV